MREQVSCRGARAYGSRARHCGQRIQRRRGLIRGVSGCGGEFIRTSYLVPGGKQEQPERRAHHVDAVESRPHLRRAGHANRLATAGRGPMGRMPRSARPGESASGTAETTAVRKFDIRGSPSRRFLRRGGVPNTLGPTRLGSSADRPTARRRRCTVVRAALLDGDLRQSADAVRPIGLPCDCSWRFALRELS